MNTYTSLKDQSWGVRIVGGDAPEPGAQIEVTKKDGSTKTETIDRIVWRNVAQGVYICSIKGSAAPRRRFTNFKECRHCGEFVKNPNQRCWETGCACEPKG